MARPVGMREVASHAGVSITTVSNVLNKPDRVSATTVARVTEAMTELGFVRNQLAHQLRTGGTNMLGMVVLNVANPFFAALAHAAEAAAEQAGYTVVLGSSDQRVSREERYLDLFQEQQVRGTLIAPLHGATSRMRALRDRRMPVVLFDTDSYGGEFCSISLDGKQGGYLATRHLIETGRKHIAFLGGPLHQVEDRWLGAMRACAETSGVRLTHIDTADQTMADGRAAAAVIEAMESEGRPDAVFAANDLLALGLLQALVVAPNISIPNDLAIIGYDDIEYAASASLPLSSVRQPVEQLAEAAVRLVLAESDDPDHVHEEVRFAPELVIRQSTTPRR